MSKIIKIILLILFAFQIQIGKLRACTCVNSPNTFIENIKANHIIFSATVLEQIETSNDSSFNFISYLGFTKLKVDKWYQNRMKSDTIYYANGQESMCIKSIRHLNIGEQIVIKALSKSIYDRFLELNKQKIGGFTSTFQSKPIVGYHICDVSTLKITKDKVIGNITKNYEQREWGFINLIKKISNSLADKIELNKINGEPKYQEWNLLKFTEKMKRKWNSL